MDGGGSQTAGIMGLTAMLVTSGEQEPKLLWLPRDVTSTASPPWAFTPGEGPCASTSQPRLGWGNVVCGAGGRGGFLHIIVI